MPFAEPIKAQLRGDKPVDKPKQQFKPNPTSSQRPAVSSKPIVIPPLPKDFMGMRIVPHEYEHYEQGKVICAYKCEPNEIIGNPEGLAAPKINNRRNHYWIWYDFQTSKPQCSTSRPDNDRHIPEAYTHQLAAHKAAVEQAQGGGIRNVGFRIGPTTPDDDGIYMVHGTPTDDFKHFMEMHPGMSFDEALSRSAFVAQRRKKHKFKEMLKGKRRSQGPKF